MLEWANTQNETLLRFDSGKAEVEAESEQALGEIAKLLKQNP